MTERADSLKILMNLKNLMSGPLTCIPDIFTMDKRLNNDDKFFIGVLLRLIDDETAMPKIDDLAKFLGCSKSNISQKMKRLWEREYLFWDEDKAGNRFKYEFTLPYESKEWAQNLRWKDFFQSKEEFTKYLSSIFDETEVKSHLTKVLLLIFPNLKDKNTIINKRRRKKKVKSNLTSKKKKSDRRKPKNGRREDRVLSDPNSIYYENDPNTTRLLINSFLAWKNHKMGNNGKNNSHYMIDQNHPHYKHFVKLRKRLMAFFENKPISLSGPNIQTYFRDYFKYIWLAYDKYFNDVPSTIQVTTDNAWDWYLRELENDFPDGGYWCDPSFQPSDLN